jgi:hypothetical protein
MRTVIRMRGRLTVGDLVSGTSLLIAATAVVATLHGCRGCAEPAPAPRPTAVPATATPAGAAAAVTPAVAPTERVIITFGDGEPDVGPAPLTVEFSVSDPFFKLEEPEFHWDFGDGTPPSNKRNPTHVYERPGRYTASLTVKDKGAVDDDTVDIQVEEPATGAPADTPPK